MEQITPQVFISHSSKNKAIANDLVAKLEESGIACWIAPRNITLGEHFPHTITEAIHACPYFLILLSQASIGSNHVQSELAIAFDADKHFIPLLLEPDAPVEALDYYLKMYQSRDYSQDPEGILAEVISLVGGRSSPKNPIIVQPVRKTRARKLSRAPQVKQNTPKLLYAIGKTYYDLNKLNEAIASFEAAAKEGYADAQYELGNCYRKGTGVARDTAKANEYYLLAASQGHAEAQYWLGFHYLRGDGIAQDYSQASIWLECAAARGLEAAKLCLRLLNKDC